MNEDIIIENELQEEPEHLRGTRWASDEAISDYAIQRRYVDEWEWDDLRTNLLSDGLPEEYVDNLLGEMKATGEAVKPKVRKQGLLLLASGIFTISATVYFMFSTGRFFSVGMGVALLGAISCIGMGMDKLKRKF